MAGEPQVQDKTEPIQQLPQDVKDFLNQLRIAVTKDDDSRNSWKQKLITATNQRLGVKRVSNKPYPGAPNIPLPETDKLIRKLKPNYVISATGSKKACTVEAMLSNEQPTPQLNAKVSRAEMGLNYVLKKKIDLLKKLSIAADNFLEKGHAIFKVIEKFTSEVVHKVIDLNTYPEEVRKQLKAASNAELKDFLGQRWKLDPEDDDDKVLLDDIIAQFRSSKEVIEFDLEMITSLPDIVVPQAEKIIVPNFTSEIEKAERITHEFFLSKRELFENASKNIYKKEIIGKLDKVMFNANAPVEYDSLDQQQARNEGIEQISGEKEELFRIRETLTWFKPEGEKHYQRWVFTYLADAASDEESLLQMMRFPYELTTWNYLKHDNETKSWRYYDSRGLPEMIRAIQEFMERAMNNALIRDEISNAPLYTVLTTSKIQANTVRFIPGQKIKVSNHAEIQELGSGMNKVDLSSERINQTLKAYAEEYIGIGDQLFRNSTNAGGGKTLGEINLGLQLNQNLITLDILLWNNTLKKLYTMIFYILRDRLDTPLNVNGTMITKEDFMFEPDITPTGSLEQLDKNNELQRAAQRYSLILQQVQLGLIATPEDLYNSVEDYLEKDGCKDASRYITKPDEVQKMKQEQAAAMTAVIDQQDAELAKEQAVAEQKMGAQNAGTPASSPTPSRGTGTPR